jgi:hypothetical protein
MIFSIQRQLEDYFERRNLADVDQYAVALANLYHNRRIETSEAEFLRAMRNLRTVFYRNNRDLERSEFDRALLRWLDSRFDPKKKAAPGIEEYFKNGLNQAKARIRRSRRLMIGQILLEYQKAVESRAIDAFWVSRVAGKLRVRPESIAQSLLALGFRMLFAQTKSGLVLREFGSGAGFVDIGVVISRILHIVELKVLTKKFQGAAQLEQYMKSEARKEGWLIVIDARADASKTVIPPIIRCKMGTIRTIVVDINPTAPSKRK